MCLKSFATFECLPVPAAVHAPVFRPGVFHPFKPDIARVAGESISDGVLTLGVFEQ